MRKIRFYAVLTVTFLSRFKFVIAGAFVVGIVLFLGGKYISSKFSSAHTSYIGLVGRYHIDELPPEVLSMIGEGLTKIDDTGMPKPSLAKSWESKDQGKTWVFKLAEGRTWHDGTPVTASSIHYSFDAVSVEYPDSNTIVFKLQSAYAPFPLVVSHATFSHGLIGTGEWRADNISVKSSYVDQLDLVNVSGEKRIIRFYPNENAAKAAYELGHIDIIQNLLDPSPLDSWSSVTVNAHEKQTLYVAVFFNERSEVFKDNKPLRQALSYAIDKSMWTGKTRAIGPIPEDSWAYNPQIKPYDFDLNRAQELIKPILPKGQVLTIRLTTAPTLLSIADQIAKDWGKIGVHTQVQAAGTLPDDYDAYLTLYEVSLDPDQYLTWHSTQEATNVTHFSNQRIDKLLENGRLEMDPEKRKKIYLDFQRFLLEDAPAAFLYHPKSFDIVRK